ncbi:MAG: PQQ-binding-like beta-propeller repeat protein [Saprospiraceae bacterium]|nr:PQQ-binding-like beta-propeller repeat protein [Saprospiraceae bacterium]
MVSKLLLSCILLICICCKSKVPDPLIATTAQGGVYTTEQAVSVAMLYSTACASCHGPAGRGTEGGPPLTGSLFLSKWKDLPLANLFDLTKNTMPKNNPRAYDDSIYVSLIAYLLQLNNYPAGALALSPDKNLLSQIKPGMAPEPLVPYKYAPKNAEEVIKSIEGDWPVHRSDFYSTNYSGLEQIKSDNVKDLKILWRWKTDNFGPTPEYNYEVTPLMVGGLLFTTAGSRRAVAAIDARTGETRWTYSLNEGARTAYAPRQNSGRGVAYWKNKNGADRVVYITPTYQLIALDAQTGLPVASFGEKGIVDLRKALGLDPVTAVIGSTSPPIIVNDVIITGSSFPTGLAPRSMREMRGDISAYDVRTGNRLWIFHTIPQQGEYGNESWKNDSWKYTGNVGAWPPLSADPELGYVYLPLEAATGDLYGGHRPGDNLFSQSLVCLDVKTGKRIWHFQMIHHDTWDYDLPAPPVLANIEVDGAKIKAVAQVSKQGFVYVFDRVTGKPVWPIIEQPVPKSEVPGEESAPTQPFPTKPLPFDRQGVTEDILIDFTPQLKQEALDIVKRYKYGPLYTPITVHDPSGTQGTLMLPSATGGANWQGAILDPETNILYVTSTTNIEAMALFSEPDISDMKYVAWWTGGFGFGQGGPQGLPLVKPPWGRITAINLNTGDHAWMIPNGETPEWVTNNPALKKIKLPPTGNPDRVGMLVTKTLLFAGEGSGLYGAAGGGGNKLRAINKSTGEVISTLTLPASQTGLPMTYSINGKQYIVLAIGGKDHPGELVALGL